ncbi:MAG TPA: SHOCT domain-containing protein [Phycisphaerales bacterium]|nr:SHOCT domain-containing protein [Phycisphaerales bacterium]
MAQSANIWVWVGVLGGIVVVGCIVIVLVRKRLLGAPEDMSAENFTLEDLRRLRDSGRMTNAEYERARRRIIGTGARGDAGGTPPIVATPLGDFGAPDVGGERRATPGFDLTGDPLPPTHGHGHHDHGSDHHDHGSSHGTEGGMFDGGGSDGGGGGGDGGAGGGGD